MVFWKKIWKKGENNCTSIRAGEEGEGAKIGIRILELYGTIATVLRIKEISKKFLIFKYVMWNFLEILLHFYTSTIRTDRVE